MRVLTRAIRLGEGMNGMTRAAGIRRLGWQAEDLPFDLALLGDCLRTIGTLLEEKAVELEPSWRDALAAAAEIETLLALEAAVAERAIAIPARSTADVRAKLAIWKALGADPDEADADPRAHRDRLVHSIDADLAHL